MRRIAAVLSWLKITSGRTTSTSPARASLTPAARARTFSAKVNPVIASPPDDWCRGNYVFAMGDTGAPLRDG